MCVYNILSMIIRKYFFVILNDGIYENIQYLGSSYAYIYIYIYIYRIGSL